MKLPGTPRATATPWPQLVLAIAAALAVLPLAVHGCSCGHDFDFHLLSWLEAASQWRHGVLRPVWAFAPAWNAGEPRLLFYPPLSWATGGVLTLLLPWKAVTVVYTWLVLWLSGVAMHRLLRRWTSPAIALLGGCLYVANPYMLFVAYERTAYAELMAAAWMPLLLAAMLRRQMSWWRVAVAVALLWLTNAPAAVVGCYSVLILGLIRLVQMRREGARRMAVFAGRVTAGVLAGLLLDAFYIVPLAVERKYVQLQAALAPLARPEANFLFAKSPTSPFHQHVLDQITAIGVGFAIVSLLCGGTLLLLRRRATRRSFHSMHAREQETGAAAVRHAATVALLVYSVIVLFLLSRWSAPVWRYGPELVFLQFPWRFLAIFSTSTTVLVALLLQRLFGGVRWVAAAAAGVVIAMLAGWFGADRHFREECGADEDLQTQLIDFNRHDGADPTDEYTPADVDNDALQLHMPEAWIGDAEKSAPPKDELSGPVPDRTHPEDLWLHTPVLVKPAFLIVRLRAFPGWHVFRDGVEIENDTARDDGLIAVPLPAGAAHAVEIRYQHPADQWEGAGVSVLALLAVVGLGRRRPAGGR